MNKKNTLIALALLSTGTVWADDLPKDSLKVIDIEEVVVIATPKETRKLREQPTAVTLLSQQDMRANQVNSVKNLTALVPNIFIPDYGSKLTTSIYIRGIGSRINTPSVGLYVDNIPYIDKSAFDFNYSDIERIDVLRGPQGTLYGRNTMGGLIKVHTKSPFTYQGTDLQLGAATYNDYKASLTHYHRVSDQFAFYTGGFYEHTGGFFRNSARNNERIDRSNAGGGRFRGIYLPNPNLKVDMTLNYEYSDQGGYPYFYTGITPDAKDKGVKEDRESYIGKISYGDRSSYYRGLLNAGVNLEYQGHNYVLSAITGYQNLKDRMFLDQDFTEQDVFNIVQKQKSNTLSEEIVLKSKSEGRWEWTTGVFGLYQWLNTDGPVTFKKDGMKNMEQGINSIFPTGDRVPVMKLEMPDQMLVKGNFDTPILSAAIYHQSTIKDLLTEGLSATIGLRLDYEKNTMKYNSGIDLPSTFILPMMNISTDIQTHTYFDGKLSNDYLQLLPKFALQYDFDARNNVYASVSKGYRSGGYNIQMFSDLLQTNLSNDMRSDLKDALLANPKLPESMKGMISQFLKPGENITDVKEYTLYKPEYSWNYEVGSHLTICDSKLWLDLAAFYMDTRNQQISKFAESGLGRITVNAGKSRSYGAEASLRASITNSLSMNASYGYTYATFTDYETNQKSNKELETISYDGKYVPFVPKHTMNVGAQYIFFISPNHWLDKVQLNANYNAAGRVYWTEQNNVSQAFYGTLNGNVTLSKGNGSITLWTKNALDKNYTAFYFETMNKGFMQKGRPMQFGIDLRCRF